MNETEKEHLKKVYTAYYSQIDFTKDFCEQNMSHIVQLQKHQGYCNIRDIVILHYLNLTVKLQH